MFIDSKKLHPFSIELAQERLKQGLKSGDVDLVVHSIIAIDTGRLPDADQVSKIAGIVSDRLQDVRTLGEDPDLCTTVASIAGIEIDPVE